MATLNERLAYCLNEIQQYDASYYLMFLQFANLMNCCGKRKKILMSIRKCMRNALALMAIRGDESCIKVSFCSLHSTVVQFSC